MADDSIDRRDFIKGASGLGIAVGVAGSALAARGGKSAASNARVIGANDRINVAVIGVGGRGSYVSRQFQKYGDAHGNSAQIVAVCDVYKKRARLNAEHFKVKDYSDYREVLQIPNLDAVIVSTPDHWHAKIALAAMDAGKDVYLEKPMCHTNDEIKELVNTVKETGRVVQIGSQTTSGDQWWKARAAIQEGRIGKMIMSQGSYHRNSTEGEWNWDIDPNAGPDKSGDDYIDWKTWLGPAPKRPWDADRFFRFRKFWDYSGGIATDLFYHVVAPMQICWGKPQFPSRVGGFGGIFVFKDTREVPDTFQLVADYPEGHSLILSSSMANSHHIPGLIRGHEGTIIMVDNGEFESQTDHITIIPETVGKRVDGKEQEVALTPEYQQKWGTESVRVPIEEKDVMQVHVGNFLDCMRSRQKPHLDVETGAHAQAVINLSVQAYRENRMLAWDEKNWKATPHIAKT